MKLRNRMLDKEFTDARLIRLDLCILSDNLFTVRILGALFSLIIVFSVVFSAIADNCESNQSCNVTTLTCNHDLPSDNSSGTNQEHHCIYHCSHQVNLHLSTLNLEIQNLNQEMSFNYKRPVTSFVATSLFRPPIA